jgi:hypothetical protein
MKLNRSVLAAVAMVACVIAGTGCKHPGGNPGPDGDPTAGDPSQPGMQGGDDPGAPNGSDDPGMRRARRHRGPHHGRGGRGGRRNWQADPGNGGPRGNWRRGPGNGDPGNGGPDPQMPIPEQ